jgi:hypothetical protein
MAKVPLGERTVFSNAAYVRVTPWVKDEETDKMEVGTKTYDITEVVADTMSVEQADNDVNTIEHEFSSSPLYENIQLGDKTFTCESIDLQNEVLKGLFGWKGGTKGGDNSVYAPIAYTHLYAVVEIGFHSTKDVIVLPKVLLNSRAVIASMKTDASRANITGTCYPAFVNDVETDMAIIKDGKKDDEGVSILAMVTAEKTATGE